jgi:salicylate hydroxylase
VNYVASFESAEWMEESWRVEGDRDELLRTHSGWDPVLRTLFERTERCYKWGLYDREPLPRWTDGRITLLGDAAHPMLPYLAQGACMAIEDGFALAEFLADSQDDIPAALQRYETARKPRATRVQLASRARARVNHIRSPFGRFVRNAKLRWRKWRRPGSTTLDAGWIYGYDVTSATKLGGEL